MMLDWQFDEEELDKEPIIQQVQAMAQQTAQQLSRVVKPIPPQPGAVSPPPAETPAVPPETPPEALATPAPQVQAEAVAPVSTEAPSEEPETPPEELPVPKLDFSYGSPVWEAVELGLENELGRKPGWFEVVKRVRELQYEQGDAISNIARAISTGLDLGIRDLVKMGLRVAGKEEYIPQLEIKEKELFSPDLPPEDSTLNDVMQGVRGNMPAAALQGLGLLLRVPPYVIAPIIGGLYGYNQYREVLERAQEAGLDPDSPEVQRNAMLQGLAEGGLEALSDMIIGERLARMAAAPVLRRFLGKEGIAATIGRFLKDAAAVVGTEVPQEAVTAGIEAYLDRQLGLESPDPITAAKMAVMPSFWGSLLFLGAGKMVEGMNRAMQPRYMAEAQQALHDQALEHIDKAAQAAAQDDIKSTMANLEKAEALAQSYAKAMTMSPEQFGRMDKAIKEAPAPTTPADLPTWTPDGVLVPDRNKLKQMLETAMPGIQLVPKGPYGSRLIAQLPNGTEFEVKWPVNIKPTFTHPRLMDKVVAGMWSPLRNLMALSGEYTTQATVDEEAYHVAQTLVLTNAELNNEIRTFATTKKPLHQMTKEEIQEALERAAAGYIQWVANWRNEAPQHSNWVKIREWAARLARQTFGIYRPEDVWYEVATGKIWSREPRPQPLTAAQIGALTQVKTPDGRYNGAPPHIKSDEDYAREVERLVNILRKEVEPQWFWFYDEAARVVKDLTNGDAKSADIVMKLLAVTSPLSDVTTNVTKALRAYLKWRHEGGDFRLPGLNKVMMSTVLEMAGPDLTKYPGVGEKVDSFYHNMVSAYYGTADDRVTNDQWMAKLLGYKNTSFTPAQYKFAQGLIQDVTERFNLLTDGNYRPKQVQSALWFWIRRGEKQVGDPYSSFHTALESFQPKLPFELFPGSEIGRRPGVEPYFRRLANILNKGDRNVLLDTLLNNNPDKLATVTPGVSGRVGVHSPNLVASFTSDETIGKESEWAEYDGPYYPVQVARLMAAATGYIYAQDGVAWFRPIGPTAAKALLARDKQKQRKDPRWFLHGEALVIKNYDAKGREVPITFDQVKPFMEQVWNEGLQIGYTLHNGTLYVCNYRFEWSGWDFSTPTETIARVLQKHLMPGWKMERTNIIGAVEERTIYEPNTEDPNNPKPYDRRTWLQEHLTPDQWAVIHNLHLEAGAIYKQLQQDFAARGETIELPEDAFTAVRELNIDPNDILDLTEEIAVHEKYVGSLNVPRFADNDNIASVAKKLYLMNKAEIDEARRLMTWQEVQRLGERLNISPATLRKFQQKKALSREEMYALIRLNKWAIHNLSAKALAYRQNPNTTTLAEAKLAYAAATEVMTAYQKAATEWGYVGAVLAAQETIQPLSQWATRVRTESAAATPREPGQRQPRVYQLGRTIEEEMAARLIRRNEIILRKVNKALGGAELAHEKVVRLTQLLSDPNTTEADVARFIKEAAPVTTSDKLFTAWINGLFGLKTHTVNMTSNMLTLLMGPLTRQTAGTFDAFESVVSGKPREVFAREGWEYALGAITALPEALKVALNTLQTNMPSFGETKLENVKPEPFKNPTAKALFTYNLRLLQAADDFAKTLIYRGSLRANIFREMRRRKPANPRQFFEDALNHPDMFTPEAAEEALREAIYRTFQMESKVADWLNKEPTGALKWVVPFKRTLVNIVKMALEHTPAELGALAVGKTFGPKPVTAMTGADVKIQLAKATLGSGIMMAGYLLASAGLLSGSGPSDKRERENLYALGWRPYTVKTPFGRLEYGRIEPLATILGLIADTHDMLKYAALPGQEQDKIIGRTLSALSRNITDKTMLMGLMKFVLAAMQPDVYGEKWWYSFITSFVPASVSQFVRAEDPVYRHPQNLVEAFKARLPIINNDVAPYYDRWGNPVSPAQNVSIIQRLLSPMPIYDDKLAHPIDMVLLKKGVRVAPPADKVRIRGVSVELTPQEQALVAQARQRAFQVLNNMAKGLENAPPETVDQVVRRVISAQNRIAKAQLLARPDFFKRLREAQEVGKLQRLGKAELFQEMVID